MKFNNRLKIFLGIMVLLLFFSGWLLNKNNPSLTEKDKIMIDQLFIATKPQCIGRYIIDVPQSFNNLLNHFIFIDDFKIESQPIYSPAFKQRIELREKELNNAINKSQNKPIDAPFIKEIIRLPDNKGIIFDRNISGENDSDRILEAHVYIDNVAFIITTNILDLSNSKYAERKQTYVRAGFSEFDMNTKQSKLVDMKSLISRLYGRKDENIPIDKGLCIPNGFIADDSNIHKNKLAFSYENVDFILGIKFDDLVVGSDDTLLSRKTGVYSALSKAKQQTIKKGALQLGGIPAQEWLISGEQKFGKPKENIPSYNFILFANESIASYQHPWLSFGLNNANKKSQYNQQQMVEIWDRIVNSLRYRPIAF